MPEIYKGKSFDKKDLPDIGIHKKEEKRFESFFIFKDKIKAFFIQFRF